nr:pilus assembly protein TadG-related protein [uncultured Halomonas sp.]
MAAIATHTGKKDKGSGRRGSRGQILPVMLFGFFITLVSLVAVFNTSRVTIEKTQLVNAADAAAYSGAIQAARALNFYAYSNRAMVANTIAAGYVVSYVSYLRYIGDFVNQVSKPRQFLALVMMNFFESGLDSFENVTDILVNNPQAGAERLDQGNGEGNMGNATARPGETGFQSITNQLRNTVKDKRNGPGNALKIAATTLGFMTVGPTDLLNWFYAATQVATHAATPSIVDNTMAQVAKSYDETIEVADTNSLEFLYWAFPMRPGVDAFGFVKSASRYAKDGLQKTVNVSPFGIFKAIPGLKQAVSALDGLAKPIGKALGWTSQDISASPQDIASASFNFGVMKSFVLSSLTTHDAWWIWLNRGWRTCLPTIVCLPPIYQSQPAIDKFGQTALYMAAVPSKGNSLFGPPKKPNLNPPGNLNPTDDPYPHNGGPYPGGSRPPNLPSIPEESELEESSSTGTIAQQADRNLANDRQVARNARGGGNYESREGSRGSATAKLIGAGAKKTVQQVRKGLIAAGGKAIDMGKFVKDIAIPDNESLLYGANWIAGDVLSNGLFANVFEIGAAFLSEIVTLGASDAITNLRYSLKVIAQGEASAKEFFKPYQGVPTYMMLTELPFTNLHPDMQIEVELERPMNESGLKTAFGLSEQNIADLKMSAAAKVFYYRQPNDDQNDYFKTVRAGPLDVFTPYLAQTPASQRLENWYGSTPYFTAFLEMSTALKSSPSDYTEFDNVFNPFWEVRLIDGSPPDAG